MWTSLITHRRLIPEEDALDSSPSTLSVHRFRSSINFRTVDMYRSTVVSDKISSEGWKHTREESKDHVGKDHQTKECCVIGEVRYLPECL
jgi:hypothetical protein